MAHGQKTAPALVRDAAAGAELAGLGLSLVVDPAAAPPQPPFAAPFTSMVPLVLRACRECAPRPRMLLHSRPSARSLQPRSAPAGWLPALQLCA